MAAISTTGPAAVARPARSLSLTTLRNTHVKAPGGRARTVKVAAHVRIQFELEGASPDVRVIGNHPALGNWNPANGLRNGDCITLEDPGALALEYKWHNGTEYETGGNRMVSLPDAADRDVTLALAVVDRLRALPDVVYQPPIAREVPTAPAPAPAPVVEPMYKDQPTQYAGQSGYEGYQAPANITYHEHHDPYYEDHGHDDVIDHSYGQSQAETYRTPVYQAMETYEAPAASYETPPAASYENQGAPSYDDGARRMEITPVSASGPEQGDRKPDGSGPPRWFREGVVYSIQTLGFCGCEGPPGQFSEGTRLLKLINEGWVEHFARLGCTVLYLGPLMRASHDLGHGYDTADYFQLDPRLGTVETLRTVVDACHGLGIRVIVDGVFNHTGRDHFAAQDVVRNGRQSQYWDWYRGARELPGGGGEIPGWEGHAGLPQLNHQNPDVRAHIMDCGRFWMSPEGANIDGWRLDVAHEVAPDFWREFNQACRGAKPDCALLGELMHGDYNTHVGPGLLDSGTNYQLSKALWSSLRDKNFWELNTSLQRDLTLYRDMCLVNFLSNHDVARVATQLEQEPRLNILAHFLLMTTRGVPCIYYGDEAAERGKKEDGDAALRNKMVDIAGEWPAGGKELYNYLQALIKLRSTSEPLVAGSQTVLYFSNTDFIFLRQTDQGEMVVVAANCDKEHANVEVEMGVLSRPPGTALRCIWGDGADAGAISEEYKIRIHIPPFTGRIFKVESPEKPKEEATDGATAEGEAPADEAAPTFTPDGDE